MPSISILQFLLPRGVPQVQLRSTPVIYAPLTHLRRSKHASTTTTPKANQKPLVLEKPTKFTPPSHSSRLLNRPLPRSYPGPTPSAADTAPKKRKRYPHTFPDEGTFMHWFLTNRMVHVCITMTTLCSLAAVTFFSEFKRTSPFADMLPPAREFFRHPVACVRTLIEIFKLNTAHTSAITAERRKRKIEDVRKRSEYRKAHGLDQGEGFGQWTYRGDNEEEAVAPQALPLTSDGTVAVSVAAVAAETAEGGLGEKTSSGGGGGYRDWEGRRKPVRKWFGIW